jgi:tetratricopeptide (TPR) repeat protein
VIVAHRLLPPVLATLAVTAPLAGQEFWIPGPLDSLVVVAAIDSNDPVAHHRVALGYWNRRKLDLAERAFREALAADPRYAPAHLGLALITIERFPDLIPRSVRRPKKPSAEALEADERARASYRMAFLLNPLVDLSLPDAPVDSSPIPVFAFGNRTEAAGLRAYWAMLQGNFRRAFGLSQWIVQQHETFQAAGPIPSEVLWIRALSGARLGFFEPGIRDLVLLVERSRAAEAADSTPGSLRFLVTNDLRYLLAYFRSRARHTFSAINTYREVLVSDLGFWMAHVRLAELHESASQWDEAVAERREALTLRPDDPMLLLDLGRTLAATGRLDAADSALAQAAEQLPRYALIPYLRGATAWARGDRQGALAGYQRFLALAPRRYAREIEEANARLLSLR